MARLRFYNDTAIPAAGTTATDPIQGVGDAASLDIFAAFDYGSGGTTAKFYVQTSLDGGETWFDIACLAFATADLTRVATVSGDGYDGTALTDGTLADNTVMHGLIGDMLRVKRVVAGTYAASTVTLFVQPNDDASAVGPVGATSVPVNAAVAPTGTTGAVIAAASGVRSRTTLIENTGDRTVFLAFGEAATTSKYPLLVGRILKVTYMGAINGITTTGTGSLWVLAEAR